MNDSYVRRYVSIAALAVPIIFGMSYLPPKLSKETITEYAASHPKSFANRIGLATVFSLLIAAPLAIRKKN